MTGEAVIIQGDARRLPLPDDSVDLIVTSPPYYQLRAYATDSPDVIGNEPTPQQYLENLWACTREWRRVLKPSGSMFVDLGDKFAGGGGYHPDAPSNVARREGHDDGSGFRGAGREHRRQSAGRGRAQDVAAKSLLCLPEAYRLGCNGMLAAMGGPDPMGGDPMIVRSVIVWQKPNGL